MSLSLLQEAREGDPVPDREGLRVRHTGGHRQVHPGEKGTEQADDWRVPGQPATVQQGCARVSTRHSHDLNDNSQIEVLYLCLHMEREVSTFLQSEDVFFILGSII